MHREQDISGLVIIIDPEIHKKAKLTREEFLERVSNVNHIRSGVNHNYIRISSTSLDEHLNLKKFYDLINYAKFDFKNYHNFAIAVEPKLYNWFKYTELEVIEKQIIFWIASFYFFVPEKRPIIKDQLYVLLFEEITKIVDKYYTEIELPNFELLYQNFFDDIDEEIIEVEKKCTEKYLELCQKYYKNSPPEFLKSPFTYKKYEDWGISDNFSFEFIEAYFLEGDWERIILKGGKENQAKDEITFTPKSQLTAMKSKNSIDKGERLTQLKKPLKFINAKDDMARSESRSDLWEKWKLTYATYDFKNNPIYSYYFSNEITDKSRKKREKISQDVKDLVWKRDDGKCAQCGSNEKLEFDHIIPVIKGGSSTYRNIQLLCEPCNRKKNSKLGV